MMILQPPLAKKIWPVFALLCLTAAQRAQSAEVCLFSGTANHSGHLEIATIATASSGQQLNLEVLLKVRASVLFQTVDYWIDEMSSWNGTELTKLAINTRELINNRVQRQLWDLFTLGRNSFQGYRVQGKVAQEFASKFPRFATYWDPAMFGRPWLNDYLSAPPERRSDLDLDSQHFSKDLRTPLALGFYQVRWLSPKAQTAAVFLGGEKHQKRLELVLQAPTHGADASLTWQVPLQIADIKTPNGQPAQITVSPDQHLMHMNLVIDHPLGSVKASIDQAGCRQH